MCRRNESAVGFGKHDRMDTALHKRTRYANWWRAFCRSSQFKFLLVRVETKDWSRFFCLFTTAESSVSAIKRTLSSFPVESSSWSSASISSSSNLRLKLYGVIVETFLSLSLSGVVMKGTTVESSGKKVCRSLDNFEGVVFAGMV